MITRATLSTIEQGLPKYRSMLAGNSAYVPPSFESIASATGTGSSGTITFSTIPQTYKHLQVRFRGFATSPGYTVYLRLNGETGSNYSKHYMYGNGSSASAGGATNSTDIMISQEVVGAETSNATVGIIDIQDYTLTTRNKTVRGFAGMDKNGGGEVDLTSGVYRITDAVTSVTIFMSGTNWTTNSTFALYGIKG